MLQEEVQMRLSLSVGKTKHMKTPEHSCTPLEICFEGKNYSLDCTAGEDEGKFDYFQCVVHLPVDK